VTTDLSGRLIRLPLWVGLKVSDIEFVVASVSESLTQYV